MIEVLYPDCPLMKSFESSLVQCIPRLRRYARALTNNPYDSDELVQDTLERALKKKKLWREESELRPWLFTIMHNILINKVRRDSITPPMQELNETIEDVSTPPDSVWVIRELKSSIKNLPDDQKQVFLLISLEEFSYEETAKILNIPIGTVMSRLHRAREYLRQRMNTSNNSQLRRVK